MTKRSAWVCTRARDIGTSPLYVFTSTFASEPPAAEDVMGVLSLIIWSLTVVVLFKYVIFILSADDHGQGGTFALYAILARALQARVSDAARFRRINLVLSTIALVSLAMVLSDGVITPVISGVPHNMHGESALDP
jgi:K+ transporter